MMISCPECFSSISNKAVACPHCGYPLQQKQKSMRKLKLPNGFGQITKLNNPRLRNPYRVMITVGRTEEGRPICKTIKPKAYFKTYNEAYQALIKYHENPYDAAKHIPISELYEKWIESYFEGSKHPTTRPQYEYAWKFCSSVAQLPISDLRTWHIKELVNNAETMSVKNSIKRLFNLMLDYALEYELVEKNYSRNFKIDMEDVEANRKHHISFTDVEMKILWDHVEDTQYVDMILVQCYSGWRPQELCTLRVENVDLERGFITGGMKTKAGKMRLVPIHPKIKSLVEKNYNESIAAGREYLFPLKSYQYSYRFRLLKTKLNLSEEHRPHDGRKHFVTIAKKYNVDEYAIKLIVGHAIEDITESIYTDRDPGWLKKEIEKIV